MPDHDPNDTFPWHLGVYDAHCHPTDIMANIPKIQNMQTRCLTVMATRDLDQALVLSTASQHGIRSAKPSEWSREQCIVPAFGWHPWFAHTMYIPSDTTSTSTSTIPSDLRPLTGAAKLAHYQQVLLPSRPFPLSPSDTALFASLPDPTPFPLFLAQTRARLQAHPLALVGEVGLDRSFRIPAPWTAEQWAARGPDSGLTPGGREGRRLTPFRCAPGHQKDVLKAQLGLAGELGRAVSLHGVQAHGALFEVVREGWAGCERVVRSKRAEKRERKGRKKEGEGEGGGDGGGSVALSSPQSKIGDDDHDDDDDDDGQVEDGGEGREHASQPDVDGEVHAKQPTPQPFPPRICLHSYSGSPANFKQYLNPAIPCDVYASFSTAINLGDELDADTPKEFEDVVRAVPDERVLVESDLHTAGDEMDRRMEDIVRRICRIKGWGLEDGVRRLGENWRAFVFGSREAAR